MTAVSLVDLRRQKAMVTGDTSSATAVDIAPTHPVTQYWDVALYDAVTSHEEFVTSQESLWKFVC